MTHDNGSTCISEERLSRINQKVNKEKQQQTLLTILTGENRVFLNSVLE